MALSLMGGCTDVTEEASDADTTSQTSAVETPVTALDAKDDFYGCINLDRLDSMEIGYGKVSNGSFDEAQDIIDERVESMIKEIGTSNETFPAGSCEQLIRDIYVSYTKFENTCDSSADTFSAVFSKIDKAQNISELMMTCAELYRDYGSCVLFKAETGMNRLDAKNYGVYVSGISGVYNSYSFENMTKNTDTALSVKSYNESFLKALGADAQITEERAEDMVNIIMDVALNTDIEILKDPMPIKYITAVKADEMNSIFTSFDFAEYMKTIGAKKLPELYYTTDKKQLEAIDGVLTEEYYSKFTIMDVYHIDGENTLGENFADLGGVECVMSVFSDDDDKKAVLESYAMLWCSLENDIYALEGLRYDVHSPATVRVNALVSACDDFYRLYDVKEGDGMYIAPENRVSRW